MLGLLKYTDDFSKTFGQNQLWMKDTSAGTADPDANSGFKNRRNYIINGPNPRGTFSFKIPLSHIFGFCEDYQKVVYGFKHTLTLVRKGDDDAIFRAAAAAVNAGKVGVVHATCSSYRHPKNETLQNHRVKSKSSSCFQTSTM